ncbi:uncharacterized protein [Littorina saxatilis]|uniref:C1q domain-containing protein n=1 Tax=Littorina saxatilis TaxID=31220 RepID=A0AAN9BY99_9CAEN
MGLLVRLLPVVCLVVLMVRGQVVEETRPPLFSDERAGFHIDNLSFKGIQMLLKWRSDFLASLSAINQTLDWVETTLDTHYTDEAMPNMTSYAEGLLSSVNSKLDTAQTMANSLNLTNDGDGLVAFMRSPANTVNVPGAFDADYRAGGTFTVPRQGLYQITIRTGVGSDISVVVNRNGNETLTSLSNNNYYDIRTRIRLAWLNEGDEIFTTGDLPGTFGVMLLRVQNLMPSSL